MNRNLAISICLIAPVVGVGPWVRAAIEERGDGVALKVESERSVRDESETEPAPDTPKAVPAKRGYLSDWLRRAAEFVEPIELEPAPSIPTPPPQPPAEPGAEAPESADDADGPSIFMAPILEPAEPQSRKQESPPEELPIEEPAPEPEPLEVEALLIEEPADAVPLFESPRPKEETPRAVTLEQSGAGDEVVEFPPLPPDPYAEEQPVLPPVEAELAHRGGAHLYAPEGDEFNAQALSAIAEGHEPPKRLPEWFQAPQPITCWTEYLGADPIQLSPHAWPGPMGYQWEPRFVLAGQYDVFGIAFEEGGERFDGLGHNLTLEVDLRLTGTERFHLQHRPIGEDGSGGSFYQFNDVDAYRDNSTAEPARVWFEGELASIFGGWLHDPTHAWDINFAVGKFPLTLHNNLLMNDEVAGVVVGNNNLLAGGASNLNARLFWLFDDINSQDADGDTTLGTNVLGADAFIDFQHAFIEATYAYRQHGVSSRGDAHYVALSGTQFFGAGAATARAMAKIAGPADSDGQLFVLEWNTHRAFADGLLPRSGIHHAVAYANAFYATEGWSPIAGANFNRIRSSFEVNPLVLIARGDRDDTPGVALGVQLFGAGDDSSLTPEVAWEAPSGTSIFGAGLRYQQRTSVQSFLELRGLVNYSDHSPFDRDGVFASHHWLF